MLLTSDQSSGDLARCRALGIARHLVKPLTPSEVLNALLSALGESVETLRVSSSAEPVSDPLSPRLDVLVAEDNRVNQLLIARLLEKLGHTAVIVGSGKEAVEMYATRTFDLALMDVQMPVMDGLAATAAIRQLELRHHSRRRLPIIALTAYAMHGDRERCLAAGMDDYLSKPIKREHLTAALSRLSRDHRAPTSLDAENSSEPISDSMFDPAAALAYVGGDHELLGELLQIFVEDGPAHLKEVQQAIAHGESADLMRAAHGLKGALQALGATRAAELAQQLESLGRAGHLIGADETASALADEIGLLLRSAMTWQMKRMPPPPASPVGRG